MGVTGLLRALEARNVHVSKYANQVVAVDAYAWLHRGVYACAWELGSGGESTKHIEFCMGRVALLLHYKIKPLLIFDGGPLPAKAAQEATRRASRDEARGRASECVRERRYEDARKWYAKAIDVTPTMAAQLVDACRARWGDAVDWLVAPYEADAQLARACRLGLAAAVISEDSDNLAYATPRVLFKLDATGAAQEIVMAELLDTSRPLLSGETIDVRGWTVEMFATMCALAGCDYVSNVRGVGIQRAHKLVARHRTLRRVLRALRFELGEFAVPATYERDVEKALLTYAHQTVYCRSARATVPLAPIPDEVTKRHDDLDFLGPHLDASLASGIAEARIEPITRRPLDRTRPPPGLVSAGLSWATKDLSQKGKTIKDYFGRQAAPGDATVATQKSPRRVAAAPPKQSPARPPLTEASSSSPEPKRHKGDDDVGRDATSSSRFFPKRTFKPFQVPGKAGPNNKENAIAKLLTKTPQSDPPRPPLRSWSSSNETSPETAKPTAPFAHFAFKSSE